MGHRTQRSRRARLGVVAAMGIMLMMAGSILVATGIAYGAVNCDSVFEGATPADPIIKTADKTQAYAGQTVTYTLTFKSTGTADNVTADCYRVGDGSNDALNALVTGFNAEKTTANEGDMGTLQHVTYTITIPDDPSLVGHAIVDRAKATSGSVESRSDLVSVDIVAPPCTENCTPAPSPTPSVAATQPTKVKGVTLGATGSSTGISLWLGIMMIVIGSAMSGSALRRRQTQR